jgi:mono/diheme cytochrome c family protein
LARETEGEAFGQWCQGCHMPQQVMNGQTDLPKGSHMFEQGGASLIAAHQKGEPVVEEGTGCVLCHRITKLEDAGGNSAFTVNLKDRESYVFEDAPGAASSTGWQSGRSTPAPPCTRPPTRRISTGTRPCASRATTSSPRHRRQYRQHLG